MGSIPSVAKNFSPFSLPEAGFGPYSVGFHARFKIDAQPAFDRPYAVIDDYPRPTLLELSPASAMAGIGEMDVLLSGDGLGLPDQDINVYRGVNSVNISGGSGISISFTPRDVVEGDPIAAKSIQAKVDTTNASPGSYTISASVLGVTTASLPFTVIDRSPYITGVDEVPRLTAGGQSSLVITGTGFGRGCLGNQPCPAADLRFCVYGVQPCEGTSHLTPGPRQNWTWSETQITVPLTASADASGYYDVQVISAGLTGNGFVMVPDGHGTGTSNTGTFPVGPSNVTLKVTRNGTDLSKNQCLFIDENAQMPPISVAVVDAATGAPVSSGSATFQVSITFNVQHDKKGNSPRTVQYPASGTVPANQPWTASFSYPFGDNARVLWTYNGTAQKPFDFCVRATNPQVNDVEADFAGAPYWFARNIAIHETSMSQFCPPRSGANKYCSAPGTAGMPIFGTPGGYGMMQLDPPPPQTPGQSESIWNWHTNIVEGKRRLSNFTGAYQFWINQVQQWEDYNARAQPSNRVGPAENYDPDRAQSGSRFYTSKCNFETSRTPIIGQPNRYWYGDAVLMFQNAGTQDSTGSIANYVSWIEPVRGISTTGGHWSFHKNNIVNKNIVYEFCTCDTIASCQRGVK